MFEYDLLEIMGLAFVELNQLNMELDEEKLGIEEGNRLGALFDNARLDHFVPAD